MCATISASSATATTIWLLYAYAFGSLAILLCMYGSGKIDRRLNVSSPTEARDTYQSLMKAQILPREPPAARRRGREERGDEEGFEEVELGMRRMGML